MLTFKVKTKINRITRKDVVRAIYHKYGKARAFTFGLNCKIKRQTIATRISRDF